MDLLETFHPRDAVVGSLTKIVRGLSLVNHPFPWDRLGRFPVGWINVAEDVILLKPN
jgi:hypothetical protein